MEEGGGMIMTCKVALVVDVFLVDSIQDPAWGAKPSLPACLPGLPVGFLFLYTKVYLLLFSMPLSVVDGT